MFFHVPKRLSDLFINRSSPGSSSGQPSTEHSHQMPLSSNLKSVKSEKKNKTFVIFSFFRNVFCRNKSDVNSHVSQANQHVASQKASAIKPKDSDNILCPNKSYELGKPPFPNLTGGARDSASCSNIKDLDVVSTTPQAAGNLYQKQDQYLPKTIPAHAVDDDNIVDIYAHAKFLRRKVIIRNHPGAHGNEIEIEPKDFRRKSRAIILEWDQEHNKYDCISGQEKRIIPAGEENIARAMLTSKYGTDSPHGNQNLVSHHQQLAQLYQIASLLERPIRVTTKAYGIDMQPENDLPIQMITPDECNPNATPIDIVFNQSNNLYHGCKRYDDGRGASRQYPVEAHGTTPFDTLKSAILVSTNNGQKPTEERVNNLHSDAIKHAKEAWGVPVRPLSHLEMDALKTLETSGAYKGPIGNMVPLLLANTLQVNIMIHNADKHGSTQTIKCDLPPKYTLHIRKDGNKAHYDPCDESGTQTHRALPYGNCLYRSVLTSLATMTGQAGHTEEVIGADRQLPWDPIQIEAVMKLRAQVSKHFRANVDSYEELLAASEIIHIAGENDDDDENQASDNLLGNQTSGLQDPRASADRDFVGMESDNDAIAAVAAATGEVVSNALNSENVLTSQAVDNSAHLRGAVNQENWQQLLHEPYPAVAHNGLSQGDFVGMESDNDAIAAVAAATGEVVPNTLYTLEQLREWFFDQGLEDGIKYLETELGEDVQSFVLNQDLDKIALLLRTKDISAIMD